VARSKELGKLAADVQGGATMRVVAGGAFPVTAW
jgi:hypothetical protein